MLLQALGIFAAFDLGPTISAWLPGLSLANWLLAFLGMTVGTAVVGLAALHGGEFLGERLLRWTPFERFASKTIGVSRATTAICILILLPGWCALTGYTAHLLGCDPYLGIPLVTVAWFVTQWALLLVCLPFWLAIRMARGEMLDAW